MRPEYIFRLVPYTLTSADIAEVASDNAKEWAKAYTDYKNNLRRYLYKLQNKRCAFCRCEMSIGTQDLTLEHLASQSLYRKYRALPHNLVVACIKCNRPKGNEETFLNPSVASISFPNNSHDFIIINPYHDNYEDYIEFFDEVIIQAKPNTGDKGKNTIKFYDLTRTSLAETRASEFKLNYKNLHHQLMQRLISSPSPDIEQQLKDIIEDMQKWV